MSTERTLTVAEARAFYNRFGAGLDWQAFYEDRATSVILAHGDFLKVRTVVEFGCGTARFAERLLSEFLPPNASYLGIDISLTMVALAQKRLARFGGRAVVRLSDGRAAVDAPDQSVDRFVSNFVLDLLPSDLICAVIDEAYRMLHPGGLLCLASLAHGKSALTRLVSLAWRLVHSIRPALVGGCRPVELREFVNAPLWRIDHCETVSAFGISCEALVAARS